MFSPSLVPTARRVEHLSPIFYVRPSKCCLVLLFMIPAPLDMSLLCKDIQASWPFPALPPSVVPGGVCLSWEREKGRLLFQTYEI